MPNLRFKPNQSSFENLVDYKKHPTKYPLISLTLNYDASKICTITKVDNKQYNFKIYNTRNNYSMAFAEMFGDGKTSFVKVNEVARHENGTMAIAYINNGVFKIRVFEDLDKHTERSQEEIDSTEINVNSLLKLDKST